MPPQKIVHAAVIVIRGTLEDACGSPNTGSLPSPDLPRLPDPPGHRTTRIPATTPSCHSFTSKRSVTAPRIRQSKSITGLRGCTAAKRLRFVVTLAELAPTLTCGRHLHSTSGKFVSPASHDGLQIVGTLHRYSSWILQVESRRRK